MIDKSGTGLARRAILWLTAALIGSALILGTPIATAQTKISSYTELAAAPASGDLFVTVDVSDATMAATGTTKKITASNLFLFRFPGSSTDNACTRYDGTAGSLQNSTGCTISDTGAVSVTGATSTLEDAGTNTVLYPLVLTRTSSNAPANGIGTGAQFVTETSAGNNEVGAELRAVVTDVTSTSEDFRLSGYTMVAGSTTLVEGFRTLGTRFTAGSAELDDGYISLFETQSAALARTTASRTTILEAATGRINISSGATYGFSATAAGGDVGTASDTALGRHAAGVAKITNGSTCIRDLLGGGTAVASASALPAPTGKLFHVTGTTNIDTITSTNLCSGVCIKMIFDDVLTVADSAIKLSAAFVTSADDMLEVCYDGTSWFENSRSVN